MGKTTKIAIFTALTLSVIPIIRFQARYDVEVNWSFREATPTNHTISLQGRTFTVPAGQSVRQIHQLKGGGWAALTYFVVGWRFPDQQLVVDGRETPLNRMHISNKKGTLRILGMGLSPAMNSQITLENQN
ncbi:hypothetical protein JIN84_18870 [Luteolibacter yonseiensis]|uniref:Uncharacterized protein n=1 Tax=Luteolibacter yonseiensis TaxID=1144680 RepID=A0A934VDL6_9BACT|nr:hypothetical protein [Luteolibacter yonseiensis]MBK1817689.1 hypothetical protein [Luteolibacter yonseiensis]